MSDQQDAPSTGLDEAMLEEMTRRSRRVSEITSEVLARDPKLNPISALVIAGDAETAERAWVELEAGLDPWKAVTRVGSYARLTFALRAQQAGYLPIDRLLDELLDLWRGSDPDDTDPRFLVLWKLAWVRNGRTALLDGRALLPRSYQRVYRGQDATAPYGIAWTTDRSIAERFADGMATRQSHRGGMVFSRRVATSKVLAYITERRESEVVLDPRDLVD